VARFTVVLDACVLYPAPLRDLLVELAMAHLFRAKWTERIHDEWIASLLEKRTDIPAAKLQRTRDLMNAAVEDCLVVGYEHLIETIDLPDANDRHVVAAAMKARADAIVTSNLKHFPAEYLAKHDIEAIHPDDFMTYQIDLSGPAVVIAAQKCRRRLKAPPLSPETYLDKLEAAQLPKTVAWLRSYLAVI
jgi:predicted nucleic acid-binding protein